MTNPDIMVSWMVHQEITYNDLPTSFGKPPSIAAKVLSRNCFQDLQETLEKFMENSNIPPIYYLWVMLSYFKFLRYMGSRCMM